MSPDSEDDRKAQFFFELASRTFAQVSESNRRMDQKIYNTLSLTATLAPILLGLFYYLFTLDSGRHLPMFSTILFFVMLGIGLFSLAAIQGFRSYTPWRFKWLDPVTFRENWGKSDLLTITKKSAGTIAHVTTQNWDTLMVKGRGFQWTLRFLVAAVAAFVIALVVLALSLLVQVSCA